MVMKKAPNGMVGLQFTCKSGYTPTLEDLVSVSGNFEVEQAVVNHPIGTVAAIDKTVTPNKVTVELFASRTLDLTASGTVTAGNHIKMTTGMKGMTSAAGTTATDIPLSFAIALNGAADGVSFTAVPLR